MKTKFFNFNSKKLIIALVLIPLMAINSFAGNIISQSEEAVIQSFLKLRMELTVHTDNEEALTHIENYVEDHAAFVEEGSEQFQLIYGCFVLLEKYNYMKDDPKYTEFLKTSLFDQTKINDDYIAKHKENEIDEWLYVITADTYSCYIGFNPIGGALKYGLRIREYYEKCLRINPNNSYCLTHLAQWFYWAPGINGGSKTKAQQNFEKAREVAQYPEDIFYADVFLSQFLFERNGKDRCIELLDEALEQQPDSDYIPFLKEVNQKGYSLFSYNEKVAREDGRVN